MFPNRNPDPYSITFSEGLYRFQTDDGVIYSCAFDPVAFDSRITLNNFLFYPNRNASPNARIASTIASILQGYFTEPEKAIMYICDPVDGKWQARQKLFRQWHENMGADFVDRYDFVIEVGEGEAVGGLIVRKDFPYEEYPGMVDKAQGVVVRKF